jgi:predicted Rdx family selenoprotein
LSVVTSNLVITCEVNAHVVWDEFRDGNVPPAYRNQAALEEAITVLNTDLGLTDGWVRSDAAACQQSLLQMLAT